MNGWKGFAKVGFGTFFKNSLFISITATIGTVLSSSVVAYGFARCKFPGRKLLFAAMLASMMLPAQVGEMLGGTLAMFACVTDPEAIVIGGGVSKAGQPLIDCIQKYYEKYAFTACKKTPIILATLGNDAGIYGSARMVIKEV